MINPMLKLFQPRREVEAFTIQRECKHQWTPSSDNEFLFDKCERCGEHGTEFELIEFGDEEDD